MRRNGEATPLVNEITYFSRGPAFEIGERSANTEQMPFGRRHFDARDDEKIVHRHAILTHQSLLEHVNDPVIRVVVGEGKAVEPLRFRGRDVLLGAGDAIARKERMRVQVDLEGHARERNLGAAKCKASVSRSGRWSARHWGRGGRASSCEKAASRRDATGLPFNTGSFFFSRLSSTNNWSASVSRALVCLNRHLTKLRSAIL